MPETSATDVDGVVRRTLPLPSLAAVFGAAFALWGAYLGSRPFHDNSFITHLATGRLILEGSFPREDVYSFTAPGEPWVIQSWLASVLYAGLERWGGSAAIHLLTVALAAALGLMVWMLTRPAQTLIPRIALAGIALAIGALSWSERPLLIGLAGLGVVLLSLEGRIPPPVLVPVLWIWANAHGSFPFALVTIVLFALGRRLDGERPEVELRTLLWASVGTVLAVLSPLGLQVLTFPVHLLGRQEILQRIIEWQSPDFSTMGARMFLLLVVIAVLGLVRNPSYRAALPLVVFVAAGLLAARNGAVATLVLLPGAARGLAGLGSLDGARRSTVNAALVGVLGLGIVLLGWASVVDDDEAWSWGLYPMTGLAWLDEQGLLDPEHRVLAPDFVGNLRTGLAGEGAGVFIDDRYDMYPAEVVRDLGQFATGGPEWSQLLDDYEIDAVIWQRDEPLTQLLAESPAWETGFQDGEWVVAVRR